MSSGSLVPSSTRSVMLPSIHCSNRTEEILLQEHLVHTATGSRWDLGPIAHAQQQLREADPLDAVVQHQPYLGHLDGLVQERGPDPLGTRVQQDAFYSLARHEAIV